MKIRNATFIERENLSTAIGLLRMARAALKRANCPNTLTRVRLALTSAAGAERHMRHRLSRSKGLT